METRIAKNTPLVLRIAPNTLSALRLVIAVAFPFLAPRWWLAAVLIAGVSDWLDGYLARRWRITSWLGGILDGLADKLFVFSVLLTLAFHGDLSAWWIPVLLARDLSVAGGMAIGIARGNRQAIRNVGSRFFGKLTTVVIFALFVALLALPERELLHGALYLLSAILSFTAAVDYGRARFRALAQ